jgi:hypothetical protein
MRIGISRDSTCVPKADPEMLVILALNLSPEHLDIF